MKLQKIEYFFRSAREWSEGVCVCVREGGVGRVDDSGVRERDSHDRRSSRKLERAT